MTERVQKRKRESTRTEAVVEEVTAPDQEHHAELDALLDEIDEVLEVNAEQFVRDYVQKGGQ